ncbi:hypothetical protein [Siphonobacter sp. BAB-5385]|nr:hypothetical protein [Siphonobacter sp. BAB-5385]
MGAFQGQSSQASSIDELLRRMDRGDFDLVAIGRSLLSDPAWVKKVREGRLEELSGFNNQSLATLV